MRPATNARRSKRSKPDSRDATGDKQRRSWGLALLLLLLVTGYVLERRGIFDWRSVVALAQSYADRWWLPPALALVTAALYTFTLPGSMMMIVTGVLLTPLTAIDGVRRGRRRRRLRRLQAGAPRRRDSERDGVAGRLLGILARRSDFLTLLAVRVAPGFPHSAINAAAGILNLPPGRFLASTALGLAIKGTLFITAFHEASRATTIEEAISWRTLAPLGALSLLLLISPPLLRRLRVNRAAPADPDAE